MPPLAGAGPSTTHTAVVASHTNTALEMGTVVLIVAGVRAATWFQSGLHFLLSVSSGMRRLY